MKLPLSNRLLTCCGFVHPNDRVADVGCDHGYLGIHLLQSGIASSVIESDINEMPLRSAMDNAAKFGVADRISFFRSDGVRQIPRDFDCMVCAGMGADTMISILRAAPWLRNRRYRLILQCQSKRPELRKYLAAAGYSISRETLAQDGKFLYPVMEVCYAPGPVPAPWEYYISPQLIADGSPLLLPFVRRVMGGVADSLGGLRHSGRSDTEMAEIYMHLQELERRLASDNSK